MTDEKNVTEKLGLDFITIDPQQSFIVSADFGVSNPSIYADWLKLSPLCLPSGVVKVLDFGMRRQNTGSAYSKVVNLANQALVQELMSDTEFFDKFQLEQIRDNEECFEISARQQDEQGAINIAAVKDIITSFGLSTAEQHSIMQAIEQDPKVAQDKKAFLRSQQPK
jgi:hypothetical protein